MVQCGGALLYLGPSPLNSKQCMSDYSESIQFVPEGGVGGVQSVRSSPPEEEDSESIAFLPDNSASPNISFRREMSGLLKPTRASSFASMESIAFTPVAVQSVAPISAAQSQPGHVSGLPLTPSRHAAPRGGNADSVSVDDGAHLASQPLGMSFGGSSIASSIQFVPITHQQSAGAESSMNNSPNDGSFGRSGRKESETSFKGPSPIKKTVVSNTLKSRGEGMQKALQKDTTNKKKRPVGLPLGATVPPSNNRRGSAPSLVGVSTAVFSDDPRRSGKTPPVSPALSLKENAAFASTLPGQKAWSKNTGGNRQAISASSSGDDEAGDLVPQKPHSRKPRRFTSALDDDDDLHVAGDANYVETLQAFAAESASNSHRREEEEEDEEVAFEQPAEDVPLPPRQRTPTPKSEVADSGGNEGGFEALLQQEKNLLRSQGLLDNSDEDAAATKAKGAGERKHTPPTRTTSPQPNITRGEVSSRRAAKHAPPAPSRASHPQPSVPVAPVDNVAGMHHTPDPLRVERTRLVLDHLDDQVRNNDQYTATFGDGSTGGGSSGDEGELQPHPKPTPAHPAPSTMNSQNPVSRNGRVPQPTARTSSSSRPRNSEAPDQSTRGTAPGAIPSSHSNRNHPPTKAIKELCAIQAQETEDIAAFNQRQQQELEELCRRIYLTQRDELGIPGDETPSGNTPKLYEQMLPAGVQLPRRAIQLSPRVKASPSKSPVGYLGRSESAVGGGGGREYHANNNGHGAWDGFGTKRPTLYTHLLPHTESSMRSRAHSAAPLGPNFGRVRDGTMAATPAILGNGVPMWDYNYQAHTTSNGGRSAVRSPSGQPARVRSQGGKRPDLRHPATHIVGSPEHPKRQPAPHQSDPQRGQTHFSVMPPSGTSRVHIISPDGSQVYEAAPDTSLRTYNHGERNTFNVHFEGSSGQGADRHAHHPTAHNRYHRGTVNVVSAHPATAVGSNRTSVRSGSEADNQARLDHQLLAGGFSPAAIRVATQLLGVTVWSAEDQQDFKRSKEVDAESTESGSSDPHLSPMFFFNSGGAKLTDHQEAVFVQQLLSIQRAIDTQVATLRMTDKAKNKAERKGTQSSLRAQAERDVATMLQELLVKQRSAEVRTERHRTGYVAMRKDGDGEETSSAQSALRSQSHWGLNRLRPATPMRDMRSTISRGGEAAAQLANTQSLRAFIQQGPTRLQQFAAGPSPSPSASQKGTVGKKKPANRTHALRKVFNVLLLAVEGKYTGGDLRNPSIRTAGSSSVTREALRDLRRFLCAEADGASSERRDGVTCGREAADHYRNASEPRSVSTTLSDRLGIVSNPAGVTAKSPFQPDSGSSPYTHLGCRSLAEYQCLCEFTASVLIPILLQPQYQCYHSFDFATFSRVLLDAPELSRSVGQARIDASDRLSPDTLPTANGYEIFFEALQ